MLDTLCLIVLLLANAWLVVVFAVRIRPVEGWASPIVFWLPFYVLHYPLRAVVLFVAHGTGVEPDVMFYDYGLLPSEIVLALAYATLFAAMLLGVYVRMQPAKKTSRVAPASINAGGLTREDVVTPVLGGFFMIYAIVFGVRVANGDAFSLYQSIEDLQRPFLVNALYEMRSLRWLLLAYAFLRVQQSRSVLVLGLTIGCVFIELSSALISTARGGLVASAFLWAVCVWMVKRRLPVVTLVGAAVLTVMFGFLSHTARRYGTVNDRGASVVDTVYENILVTRDAYADDPGAWLEQALRISARFSFLDAIILVQRQRPSSSDSLYSFGSVVELGNFVPRPLWPNRPHLSFNHEMTHAVWGFSRNHFLEMPIGRIGESIFVLGWLGLLVAPFYAMLWSWLYRRFYLVASDDLGRAVYLALAWLIVLPDAYLLFNIKSLAVLGTAIVMLRMEATAQYQASQRLPAPAGNDGTSPTCAPGLLSQRTRSC